MRDPNRKVIGIRLRNVEGRKWAVKGSRQGLFIPTVYPFDFDGTLYIVEGPTDLAAALTLGLYALGRPACLGQEEMILQFIRAQKVRRLVIVTDNDEPGLRGAAKLQSVLPVLSCIHVPPAKDIREFLNLGGRWPMIEACIKDTVWTSPTEIRDEAA
jgi:5S rRNA maturation endonuclease (ribonuclease M5)